MVKSLKPVGTIVAAASAAGVPVGDAALAQGPLPQGTWVSVEGGVAFSNYWRTTFPGNPTSLLPSVFDSDKTGSPPVSTGPLQSKHNLGGYGSFSLGTTVNPTVDWRFSVAVFEFGTTTSSASASQFFTGGLFPFTNTASISERDRFAFQLADFDFGKNWSDGTVQFRAFAGLRALHTIDRFNVSLATDGTDKIALFTIANTVTDANSTGKSEFTGVGPRIGLDVSVGSPFGLVGSVSAAFIGGYRNAHFDQISTTTTSIFLGPTTTSLSQSRVSDNRADWVGNLSGMIGATWQFNPTGQLIVGYKIDEWFNIRDSFKFAGFNNKQDLLVQTPFLKVLLRY
jgi:hypothetical protein